MRRVILAAVGTIAGLTLLLSFKTRPTTRLATPPSAISGPNNSSPAPQSTSGTSNTTVTGAAAQTRYGPVQVKVTVTNGQVSAVEAVEYPQETPRDSQINAYAIPELNKEALTAKSAKIDTISGATYTSDGYITSLQSALDKAGVA